MPIVVADKLMGISSEHVMGKDVVFVDFQEDHADDVFGSLLDVFGHFALQGGYIISLHLPESLNRTVRAVKLVRSVALYDRMTVIEVPNSRLFAAFMTYLFATMVQKWDDSMMISRKADKLLRQAVAYVAVRGRWRQVVMDGVHELGRRSVYECVRSEVAGGKACVVAWSGQRVSRYQQLLDMLKKTYGEKYQSVRFDAPCGFPYTRSDYLEIFFYPKV